MTRHPAPHRVLPPPPNPTKPAVVEEMEEDLAKSPASAVPLPTPAASSSSTTSRLTGRRPGMVRKMNGTTTSSKGRNRHSAQDAHAYAFPFAILYGTVLNLIYSGPRIQKRTLLPHPHYHRAHTHLAQPIFFYVNGCVGARA
jgi:hypothetical protein